MHCDSDESHLEFQQHRFVLLLQAQLAAAKSFCLEDSVREGTHDRLYVNLTRETTI